MAASTIADAQGSNQLPQPNRRPGIAALIPGPRDPVRDSENPNLLNPPATDAGTVPNLRFSFADAHMRQSSGRLDTSGDRARTRHFQEHRRRQHAAQCRALSANCIGTRKPNGPTCFTATRVSPRSIHKVAISSMTSAWATCGTSPAAFPIHSGSRTGRLRVPARVRQRAFDEDSTFLISDWFKHTPNEILGKNFGVPSTLFGHTPDPSELYIFKSTAPGRSAPTSLPARSRCRRSSATTCWRRIRSGPRAERWRITDSSNFPASKTIAAALVEVLAGRDAANCTGIRTQTSGNTILKARAA